MEVNEEERGKDVVHPTRNMSDDISKTFVSDTGYAWVILTACFFANMLQFGYQKAFGLLFVKFLEEFQAPVSFTSIILGLFEAITSLASLFIMGVLLDYWSIRVYGILGALLSATGVALSAFAMSVEYLIFSHSVLVGIGYAFSFGPMFVLISRHFKKRRGLAFAISSAGVSAGGMTTPLIISTLLESFSLQNTLLIFSAIMASAILCATLYTDPTSQTYENSNSLSGSEKSTDESLLMETFDPSEKPVSTAQTGQYDDVLEVIGDDNQNVESEYYEISKNYQKTPKTPENHQSNTPNDPVSIECNLIDEIIRRRDCNMSEFNKILVWTSSQRLPKLGTPSKYYSEKAIHELEDSPLKTKSRSMSASILEHCSFSSPVSAMNITGMSSFIFASSPCLKYNTAELIEIDASDLRKKSFVKKCKNLLDLNLFKNPIFWFIAGFTAFGRTGLVLAEAYIPPLAQENGLSEYQSSVLLSVIGALDVIFRIVPGIIIEFRIVKAQHIVIFSLIVLGTVFQFISFFNDFATLMVLSCLYGIFGGSYFTLLAVILIDIMNIDNFGKIFGFVQIFHGVSSFVIFPAAGGLKDLTGTYTSCFQFLGACLLLSSIILLFEPLVKKHIYSNSKNDPREITPSKMLE